MYRVGICDDDKILCSLLEAQIQRLSAELLTKFEIEVWYSGESLECDLKKGAELDIIFLDIELLQKNGIEIGTFIRDEMEDTDTHIVYISSKQGYAMELFKVQPLEFLVKPISAVRLKEVLERSMKRKKYAESCFEYQRGSRIFRVSVREILYFMSMDKKVLMIKKEGQEEYVSEYSYESIKMMNGDVLSVSKPYRKEVRAKVKQYLKEKIYNVL